MGKKFIAPIIHVVRKFTVFDWLFCIVLIVVGMIFLVNRSFRQDQWVSVRLKVTNDEWWYQGSNPESWYGLGLSNGQFAYDTFGKKVSEIQSIENYDVGGPQRLLYVNLKLLTTYNKNTHTYTFNYQTLQIGKSLDLTFDQSNLRGLVTYIGDNTIKYNTTHLEVKLTNLYPWEAIAYTKGAQIKDLNGSVMGEIESVDIADAVASEFTDTNGRIVLLPTLDSTRKDVTLELFLKTYAINHVPYFIDGSAIKIGNKIWLQFERTAINNAAISNIY